MIEAAPLVLSASSVTTYLKCGRLWEAQYLLGLHKEPTGPQALGLAAHTAVEHTMRQKMASHIDLPEDEVVDVFVTALADLGSFGAEEAAGIAAIRCYLRDAAPYIEPAAVEQPFQFEVNRIPYSGQIDLIDSDGTVRDTKFVSRAPTADTYRLNMTGYALVNGTPATTMLDAIVKNQRPKYVAVPVPITERHVQHFAATVSRVHDNILAGRFPPCGKRWCPACR